jgi:glutathionylspermidine synthase
LKREASPPRPDFAAEAASLGFEFAFADGEPYWDERVRYVFTRGEVEDHLEKAAADLHALCLELVGSVVQSDALLTRLRIPRHAWRPIAESWRRRDPTLYGRFDFAYDGSGPPKLLEYNADTPTSLFEAAVVQWRWLEQMIARGCLPDDADQFNSLHERLIARWRAVAGDNFVHLACIMRSVEDRGTLAYIEDCAGQAGLATKALDMGDIGLHRSTFVDRSGRPVRHLFKLYAWEWMFADPFGNLPAISTTRFVEPPWKMILSNKGMLALLWEMAPEHPNLLPCYFEDDAVAARLRRYARKPLYSREGADIELVSPGGCLAGISDGYGAEGFVRQELSLLPQFDGRYPVIGCWVVGDEPAGMGLREEASPITTNRACFVPHVILD